LENVKELVNKFKKRMNAEVRRQENLDRLEERDFRRGELPEKYTAKILYRYRDDVRVVNNKLDSIIFNLDRRSSMTSHVTVIQVIKCDRDITPITVLLHMS